MPVVGSWLKAMIGLTTSSDVVAKLYFSVGLARAEARGRRPSEQARPADAGEEHGPHAAEHADRREHRLDQREPQFRVGEEALVADKLQVVVAAQFGVAAVVEVVRRVSRAVEAAEPERRDAVGRDALVVAEVAIERLPRQRVAELRRDGVRRPERVAGQRPVLAEHRRLARQRDRERHREAVVEGRLAVQRLLVVVRVVLQLLVVEALVVVGDAARQLEPRVAVERVDREQRSRR